MCGIAGFWETGRGAVAQPEVLAGRMASAIAHRGPDDYGAWADPTAGIAFGHRRLAVIDLSPAGHQPMIPKPAHREDKLGVASPHRPSERVVELVEVGAA